MKINLSNEIMKKIKKEKITMRPRWVFILGSIIFALGIFFLITVFAFIANIIIFRLSHEPLFEFCQEKSFLPRFFWKRFPLRESILAFLAMLIGFFMTKKFDFSYKKNFFIIILSVFATVLAILVVLNKMKMADNLGKRHCEIIHGNKCLIRERGLRRRF